MGDQWDEEWKEGRKKANGNMGKQRLRAILSWMKGDTIRQKERKG